MSTGNRTDEELDYMREMKEMDPDFDMILISQKS